MTRMISYYVIVKLQSCSRFLVEVGHLQQLLLLLILEKQEC